MNGRGGNSGRWSDGFWLGFWVNGRWIQSGFGCWMGGCDGGCLGGFGEEIGGGLLGVGRSGVDEKEEEEEC